MGLLEQWEAAKKAGRGLLNPQTALDFTRGGLMSGTTDLLGYPVDLATMALRPLGYNVEKPVGGSDWLADKLTSPTGTKAEMAGRVAGGLLTPGPEDMLRMTGLLAPKAGPVQELITYHGSPHRINNVDDAHPLGRFDLSKVGTGEGAQAYGHGIYLAENPGVAKSYKKTGVKFGDEFEVDGLPPGPAPDPMGPGREAYLSYQNAVAKARGHGIDGAIAKLDEATKAVPEMTPYYAAEREWLESFKRAGATSREKGHLYTVDLPDEHIANMLDWDAPLSEQPEAVRKAVEQYVGGLEFDRMESLSLAALAGRHPRGASHSPTGEQLYGELRDVLGSDVEASNALRSLGIPGIKYFDGGSRAAGEGTRNFVIFDGDTAKILKRE